MFQKFLNILNKYVIISMLLMKKAYLRRCSTTASTWPCQGWDVGSIPITCSRSNNRRTKAMLMIKSIRNDWFFLSFKKGVDDIMIKIIKQEMVLVSSPMKRKQVNKYLDYLREYFENQYREDKGIKLKMVWQYLTVQY